MHKVKSRDCLELKRKKNGVIKYNIKPQIVKIKSIENQLSIFRIS